MTTTHTPTYADFGLEVGSDEHIRWFDYDSWYTVEVGDNRYRLKISVDEFMSGSDYINDCDESIFGKVSKYAYDYWRDGKTPRPEGFTGRARKVEVDRGYWMWWDPPATLWVPDEQNPDGPYREVVWEQAGDEATKLARQVEELLRGGVYVIGVERQERCDMHQWHTVNEAWLGGVDKPHPEHINELIEEVS